MVLSQNPNLLLLMQLIFALADTFGLFLILSGILAKGVEVGINGIRNSPLPGKPIFMATLKK